MNSLSKLTMSLKANLFMLLEKSYIHRNMKAKKMIDKNYLLELNVE